MKLANLTRRELAKVLTKRTTDLARAGRLAHYYGMSRIKWQITKNRIKRGVIRP